MILPYEGHPLTVGELRDMLNGMDDDTPIFAVLDKSDNNLDDYGGFREAHPIKSAQRELMFDCEGMDDEPEVNFILHLADEFYDTYECKIKAQ